MDELIYLSILNADHLAGPKSSLISPQAYQESQQSTNQVSMSAGEPVHEETRSTSTGYIPDVLVIGMGLSGLSAAWRASQRGKKVKVIAKGGGSLYWHTGCIDVLGYHPQKADGLVESPLTAIQEILETTPQHPYALFGTDKLDEALDRFKSLCASQMLPYQGSIEKNWFLPSAVGALRPTCLAPESMLAGDLSRPEGMLILGFKGFADFYPHWMAANISLRGIACQAALLELPSLKQKTFITSRVLAEAFDQTQFTEEVIQVILATPAQQAWPGSSTHWIPGSAWHQASPAGDATLTRCFFC